MSLGPARPVYRGGRWTEDTHARRGDVFDASEDEAMRCAYKLLAVNPAAYGAVPEGAEAPPPPEAPVVGPDDVPDWVDIDLYRTGGEDSTWYLLPNGVKVNGRQNALEALGVVGGRPDE